jgi:hypothetical protein
MGRWEVDQHYRESMLSRLMNTIMEALGRPLRFPEGYKPMLKTDGMTKYNGSSKFGDLENWLATVAYCYALLKFGGDDHDTDRVRVLSLAEYLEGDALGWYTAHVLSAKRSIMDWSFCDVITGLYDRYILPTSMQDAREGFRKVWYMTTLGIQGFYDALLEHAQNMVVYPDNYTILEEFMAGLPQAMLIRCFRDHRLLAEANWVGAAKEIERCDKTESFYKERSKHRAPTTMPASNLRPAIKTMANPKRDGYRNSWTQKKEKEEGSNHTVGNDRSAILDDTEEAAEAYEIEVPAGDFYEDMEADPEFIASLHAFPIKELQADAVLMPHTPGREPPRAAVNFYIPKPSTPAIPENRKYRFQHAGKTCLRPPVPPKDKECLASWVTIGDLAAWALWIQEARSPELRLPSLNS